MGDPTILGMIHESVQNIEKDVKATNKQVVKNQLEIERNNGRLYTQATEIKNIKNTKNKMKDHMENPDIHFDKEKLETTTLGYWAKKKMLVILVTTLGIIVPAITGVVVAWLNGMFGGP